MSLLFWALTAPLVLASPSTLPTAAQKPAPEIAKALADLDVAVDAHGKADAKAIETVRLLAALYEKCGPEDKADIAPQIGRALRDPRPRPDKKSYEDKLAMAAAQALGGMGDAGAKELAPALALKHFRINGPLTEETIAALGRTRSKIAVESLLEMAGLRSEFCVRGAARGMASFGDADGSTRKKLFEALLKPMQSLADEARDATGPAGGLAKAVFEGARDATYAALATLSGTTEPRDIDAWTKWWNDNKQKRWEAKKA